MKIVCFGVGVLIALSSLSSVSSAMRHGSGDGSQTAARTHVAGRSN